MPSGPELGQRRRRRGARGCPRRCRRRRAPARCRGSAGERAARRAPARDPSPPRRTPERARARRPGSRRTPSTQLRVVQRAQAGGERVGQRLGLAGELVDDAARALAGEHGDRVVARRRSPRLTASEVHGEPSSSSAKQKLTLPGLPCAARSTPPGRPPPTLRTTSCTARPMVRLARLPWPSTLTPLFMPIARVPGPLQMMTGPTGIVVASTPWMLNSSLQTASTAAITHGRYSGLQPAITALIATFSTVTSTRSGGTTATISSRRRGWCRSSIRSTRSSVGGTTGRPSVQPRSNSASISSSASASSTRRARSAPPLNRARSASTRSGSTDIDPQPGRITGRSVAEVGDAR